jgi:hypothetical protein
MNHPRKRRLVFPGFPCSAEVWRAFVPDDAENTVVPFSEILGEFPGVDFPAMVRSLERRILAHRPDSIIVHDYGGPGTLLALRRARKKDPAYRPKLVVFNTVCEQFDPFQNPYIFRMIRLKWRELKAWEPRLGTDVDPAYEAMMGKVRLLYLKVLVGSLLQKVPLLRRHRSLDLGLPTLFLKSPTDPYLSPKVLGEFEKRLAPTEVRTVDYGHFPVRSIMAPQMREWIVAFEGL